jgi:hypothetical protein
MPRLDSMGLSLTVLALALAGGCSQAAPRTAAPPPEDVAFRLRLLTALLHSEDTAARVTLKLGKLGSTAVSTR